MKTVRLVFLFLLLFYFLGRPGLTQGGYASPSGTAIAPTTIYIPQPSIRTIGVTMTTFPMTTPSTVSPPRAGLSNMILPSTVTLTTISVNSSPVIPNMVQMQHYGYFGAASSSSAYSSSPGYIKSHYVETYVGANVRKENLRGLRFNDIRFANYDKFANSKTVREMASNDLTRLGATSSAPQSLVESLIVPGTSHKAQKKIDLPQWVESL